MDELKTLYLRLSKQAHPDAGPEAERYIRTIVMQQINLAYKNKDMTTLRRLSENMPGKKPAHKPNQKPPQPDQKAPPTTAQKPPAAAPKKKAATPPPPNYAETWPQPPNQSSDMPEWMAEMERERERAKKREENINAIYNDMYEKMPEFAFYVHEHRHDEFLNGLSELDTKQQLVFHFQWLLYRMVEEDGVNPVHENATKKR